MAEETAEKRKGLHPLAWIGIGCGTLVVVVVVVVVVLGAMGVGLLKGKVEEVQEQEAERRERWMADAGMATGGLEKLSGWFVLPEGLSGVRSIMHREENGRMSGQVAAESALPPLVLGEAFADNLREAGFDQRKKIATEEVVTYHFREGRRSVSVTITARTGMAPVVITYAEE